MRVEYRLYDLVLLLYTVIIVIASLIIGYQNGYLKGMQEICNGDDVVINPYTEKFMCFDNESVTAFKYKEQEQKINEDYIEIPQWSI